LSAQIPLSHPESLVIFFADTVNSYSTAVGERLSQLPSFARRGIVSASSVIGFWENVFTVSGILQAIRKKCAGFQVDYRSLGEVVHGDRVLITKEHPESLGDQGVNELMMAALRRFELKVR
jgi:hypothetical protein